MKKAGEWERDLEKKLIRPVTGKKPLILNKSPYNPGGFFCSAATLCVFSVACFGKIMQMWLSEGIFIATHCHITSPY